MAKCSGQHPDGYQHWDPHQVAMHSRYDLGVLHQFDLVRQAVSIAVHIHNRESGQGRGSLWYCRTASSLTHGMPADAGEEAAAIAETLAAVAYRLAYDVEAMDLGLIIVTSDAPIYI